MPAAEFAVVNESLLLIIQYLFAHIKNTLAMYKVQTAPSSEPESTPQPSPTICIQYEEKLTK